MSETGVANLIASVQLFLCAILAMIAFRETRFLRDLWLESERNGDKGTERSWLLHSLWVFAAVITVACTYFIFTIGIGILYGSQPVLRVLSTLILIFVLLTPRRIGQQFRERMREAARKKQREGSK